MKEIPSLSALTEQLLQLQGTVRALRRRTEDLLFHLEEENMPLVSEKLEALAARLSLLVSEDATPKIKGEALADALNEGPAALSLDAAQATGLYKNPVKKTAAMYLLAVDENGKLRAVIE